MANGPSGLQKNVPPGTFLTDLDEFVSCYRAPPACLINILEFLDFDDEGNNRNLHIPEEETKGNPQYKQIWPAEGFSIKTLNGEGGLVLINICHCDDIVCPSNALLDTLLNMTTDELQTVDLPVCLGKPHRERDEKGDVCLAFDVILNTDFYEKQVLRYELLKAYVLVMVMRGLNDKHHLDLQMTIVAQVTEHKYWGTMPQNYINRKKSAFYEDQEFARVFYAARAKRTLRWAKKYAIKRLRKPPGRSYKCFRIRPVHPPRSRTTPCRECIRRNLVNPDEVREEDSADEESSEEEREDSEEEVEEGSKESDSEEEDGSDEFDDSGEEEGSEVEKDSEVPEASEEDDGSEGQEGFEEEGSEREEDFEEEEGSEDEEGFEEETGSEVEDGSEEDEGSEEEFEDGCYEEAEEVSGEDIEVDSQEKVDERFEEESSSVGEYSGEEGDVEEGSYESYSEEEEDSEESETSEEDSEEEENLEDEDPEKEKDSEERMNLEKEIERDLKEEVENVLMKGVDKVLIQKDLKEEVEKEIREEVEKYLREEVKKYFENEVVKDSYQEVVKDPYKKENYGMKIIDQTEAAVPPSGSIIEPLSPTPGLEASVSMQADFPLIRDVKQEPPLKVEYMDFENGIYRIGIILEDEHLPSPSVLPPGTSWKESVLLLNSIVPKENSLNLDFELFEILEDEQLQYVAILDLPPGTKVEGMGAFASADGVVLCDDNGMRFCEIPLEYAIIPTQIKVTVNRLKVTIAIPFTEEAMRYRMAEEEVPDILDYLRNGSG